ncbi:AraC family transcriptional regulator [Parabacteroides sp. OttesenSCG-928-N08]|nr:AraC family transcriptional regulator [Parabacteroides sp. OttesenSCG-928-N08]
MKRVRYLCILLFIAFPLLADSGTARQSAANPFLEMIGKSYADYHDDSHSIINSTLHKDSLSRVEMLQWLNEAAAADPTGEWELHAAITECTVRFYESRKGRFVWSDSFTAEDFTTEMVALAEQAEKRGLPLMRLLALFHAAEGYNHFVHNYEQAFSYYLQIADELDRLSSREFPPRPHIYNQIASLYYTFREYDNAIIYYRKVVEDPDVRNNYYNSVFPAMNGMGLSYRKGAKDFAMSDSCFRQILHETASQEINWSVWEGIAKGNLGHNYYKQGDYDMALTLLVPSIEQITRVNDVSFVMYRAIDVADIYVEKNELDKAKRYIDLALKSHVRTNAREKDCLLYEVMTKYYSAIGDRKAAVAYLDSTIRARDKENERYSGLVLHHVEQQLRAADERLHEQELDAEQAKSRMYLQIVIIVGSALSLIAILLGLALFYQHRKRMAYRELVRQNQNWAGVNKRPIDLDDGDEESDQVVNDFENPADLNTISIDDQPMVDRIIMERIEQLMAENKLFKQNDLTLDSLASSIGHNRYYTSIALNRCTGGNFKTYINEYRVKEAIRIMSQPENSDLTIDAIAFDAGFNDRISFYRVFKKRTGLSPTDFRKNMKSA